MSECKTVTLRTRPLKNGMLSFYLDYYPGYRDQETMKTIRHEGLNIYIYANPKNQRERDFNATMSEKAEAIRCRRFEAIVNERYDFFDKRKYKADFLEYYRNIIRKSKFPQNPKRSVRFSGKGTKRSVQKRKARNTQKAETKVL